MSLFEGDKGATYIVKRLEVNEHVMHRLQAVGILEGTKVQVVNKKKQGAIIIKVRGSRWAIGKEISQGIIVGGDQHE